MIRFGSIEIIELPMVVGDNPSAIGVPISLDWWHPKNGTLEDDDTADDEKDKVKVNQRQRIDETPQEYRWIHILEEYENARPLRRTRRQLHLNRKKREEMLLRNGFSLVEIRSAEYEALIIRRSRRLSQEDQLSEEEYEDSNSCQEEDCIKKNMEQYERTLRHDKWAETPGLEEENAKINIREEIMSPIKPQRRSIPAGITRLDMCLPYSSPPTKEKETNGCNSSTVWRTGGSPDQPLKIVARRTSCESFDDSLDLSSFSDEEASFEEGDDESDYDDMDSSDEVSVTTYGSEGSLSFDSRLSPSALQNLYAGDISPWPPLQPLVTSARTA